MAELAGWKKQTAIACIFCCHSLQLFCGAYMCTGSITSEGTAMSGYADASPRQDWPGGPNRSKLDETLSCSVKGHRI